MFIQTIIRIYEQTVTRTFSIKTTGVIEEVFLANDLAAITELTCTNVSLSFSTESCRHELNISRDHVHMFIRLFEINSDSSFPPFLAIRVVNNLGALENRCYCKEIVS